MSNTLEIKGRDGIFATRFRDLLKLRNYTQSYVAEQTHLKGQTVSQYVNGEVLPNAEKLRDIAQCLGVSADYLIGMSDITGVNVDDKAINKALRLSEKAIAVLKQTTAAACVNTLLEEPERKNGTVLEHLQNFLDPTCYSANIDDTISIPKDIKALIENTPIENTPVKLSRMETYTITLNADDFITLQLMGLQQALRLYKSELDAKNAGGGQ